jgi:hypothetical protein
MVVVKTLDGLRDEFHAYRLMESYEGFLKPSKKPV